MEWNGMWNQDDLKLPNDWDHVSADYDHRWFYI